MNTNPENIHIDWGEKNYGVWTQWCVHSVRLQWDAASGPLAKGYIWADFHSVLFIFRLKLAGRDQYLPVCGCVTHSLWEGEINYDSIIADVECGYEIMLKEALPSPRRRRRQYELNLVPILFFFLWIIYDPSVPHIILSLFHLIFYLICRPISILWLVLLFLLLLMQTAIMYVFIFVARSVSLNNRGA